MVEIEINKMFVTLCALAGGTLIYLVLAVVLLNKVCKQVGKKDSMLVSQMVAINASILCTIIHFTYRFICLF